jgi:dienelactone hydrolase
MVKLWVLAAASLCACTLQSQTIELIPDNVLSDEVAVIRAMGLPPNGRVTIEGRLSDGGGHSWISQAEFSADDRGTMDVSRQAPVKGSYKEVSAMGLIWSMKPVDKNVDRYTPPPDLGVQLIEFRLMVDGKQVSSAQLTQRAVAEGVRQIKIDGELHGILFVPAGSGRHAGVLVVGGSEGGLPMQKAAWLASHGFVAFALAYFRYENLPANLEAIPLEYFGSALGWMRQRPEVLPDRIAVMGTSRGGELALQLGSMYPKVSAVVAYVPANVRYPSCCNETRVPYAWTWQKQALAFSAPSDSIHNSIAVMQASIPVEHIRGPVLLISGDDDGVWPSSMMANAIATRLKTAHFAYQVTHLDYSHAGHLAGRPEIVPAWHRPIAHFGKGMAFGGTPEGEAESSLDAIPKVLEFLRTNLESGVPSNK